MQLAPDLPDYMAYGPTSEGDQPGMFWECAVHHDSGFWFTNDAVADCLEDAQRHARKDHGWEPGVITMSSEES